AAVELQPPALGVPRPLMIEEFAGGRVADRVVAADDLVLVRAEALHVFSRRAREHGLVGGGVGHRPRLGAAVEVRRATWGDAEADAIERVAGDVDPGHRLSEATTVHGAAAGGARVRAVAPAQVPVPANLRHRLGLLLHRGRT